MYSVIIEQRAGKTLKILPHKIRTRINRSIEGLKSNPRPYGYKKLKNRDYYRIRIGDYRVIYTIKEREVMVVIIYIGHRRDVYRYLE
jgi:mRNA interferase RelE/StbE